MKKARKILFTALSSMFLFGGFMLWFGLNGYAYIDPSVITYLIQILSGIVISMGAIVGVYGRRIKKILAKKLGLSENSKKETESDDIRIW
ncbi:MAG: hypothetical protein Q4D54_08100 [Eubacteriales bacterium]|nr:hypothetical protein [Lachnospiraceae bacterium]MDO5127696.1 hypothetical protein [Eubacteriales bacterium]